MRGNIENFDEKVSSDGGTEYDTFRPIRGEASIVIGVKMGEEVRNGEISGIFETVDDKASSWDEFWLGDRRRDWRERKGQWD